MFAGIRAIIEEIGKSRALIALFFVLAGVGAFEVSRSFAIMNSLSANFAETKRAADASLVAAEAAARAVENATVAAKESQRAAHEAEHGRSLLLEVLRAQGRAPDPLNAHSPLGFIASKDGAVYHKAGGCGSAGGVKNGREFATAVEAEKAGLRPCLNCFRSVEPP